MAQLTEHVEIVPLKFVILILLLTVIAVVSGFIYSVNPLDKTDMMIWLTQITPSHGFAKLWRFKSFNNSTFYLSSFWSTNSYSILSVEPETPSKLSSLSPNLGHVKQDT